MRIPRSLTRRGLRLARAAIAVAGLVTAAAVDGQPAAHPDDAPAPVTVVDLQPFRTESAVDVQAAFVVTR